MTYSSTVAMGRSAAGTNMRGQNSVTFKVTDRRLGPVSNTIILIVLACLLGLLYLTQVTKTNSYGYKIDALQKQQASLEQQRQDLSVASARSQNLDQVASSTVATSMTAATPSGAVN